VLPELGLEAVRTKVERAYGAPVAAVLPLCEDMVRLGSGDLFALRFPDHPLTQAVAAVARHVVG
jgi:hypothetical protein